MIHHYKGLLVSIIYLYSSIKNNRPIKDYNSPKFQHTGFVMIQGLYPNIFPSDMQIFFIHPQQYSFHRHHHLSIDYNISLTNPLKQPKNNSQLHHGVLSPRKVNQEQFSI